MTTNIAILAFPDLEELDALGPWEVLSWAAKQERAEMNVFTIGSRGHDVTCAKGLRIQTDYTIDDHPAPDIILVPGGQGTRPIFRDGGPEIDWIQKVAPTCRYVTSVCTGALLLHRAGLLQGKQVTTYWGAVQMLKDAGGCEVLDDVRFVRDGNLITSAGISAGMDMSLWLVGELYDPAFARFVQKGIEYFPAPPYTAAA